MNVKPRIKLSKEMAAPGEVVRVEAFFSHLMESGERKDSKGMPIPRKILNHASCTVNGALVFSAELEPAISANPYLQFSFKAKETGKVVVTCRDDDGSTITGEANIVVR